MSAHDNFLYFCFKAKKKIFSFCSIAIWHSMPWYILRKCDRWLLYWTNWTYHDQYQIFQAAESFFICSISFTGYLIVKLRKKSATLQIIFHILRDEARRNKKMTTYLMIKKILFWILSLKIHEMWGRKVVQGGIANGKICWLGNLKMHELMVMLPGNFD
jgi:hypothetical protein